MSFDPFQYFVDQGWTPNQAAGIVGNLYGESNLNPAAVGDGGRAYGIAQWHPDRQQIFKNAFGLPIFGSSVQQQAQFVQYELMNNESAAGRALRETTSIQDATRVFMQKYERPANSSSFGSRLNSAMNVIKKGSGILDTVKNVLAGNPLTAPLAFGANILGIGGKSWIDQIRDWLAESNFWQRLAIGFLAILLIVGAIYLLGSGSIKKTIQQVAK